MTIHLISIMIECSVPLIEKLPQRLVEGNDEVIHMIDFMGWHSYITIQNNVTIWQDINMYQSTWSRRYCWRGLPPCLQRKSSLHIGPGSAKVLNLLIHCLEMKNSIKLGCKKDEQNCTQIYTRDLRGLIVLLWYIDTRHTNNIHVDQMTHIDTPTSLASISCIAFCLSGIMSSFLFLTKKQHKIKQYSQNLNKAFFNLKKKSANKKDMSSQR